MPYLRLHTPLRPRMLAVDRADPSFQLHCPLPPVPRTMIHQRHPLTLRDSTIFALILLLALPGFTIAGNSVSGVWTLDDSPIVISDDIFVPEGSSLEIEAGVRVLMPQNGEFTVFGELHCHGTEKNPIILEPNEGSDGWEGIEIIGDDLGLSSTFTYTIIQDTEIGLSVIGGAVSMDHCEVVADYIAVKLAYGSLGTLTHSDFHVESIRSNADGIYARESHLDIATSAVNLHIQIDNGAAAGSGIYMHHASGSIDSVDVDVISSAPTNGISLLVCDDDVTLQRSSIRVQYMGPWDSTPCAGVQAVSSDVVLDRLSIHLNSPYGDLYGVRAALNADIVLTHSIIAAPDADGNDPIRGIYIDPTDPSTSVHVAFTCHYRMQSLSNGGSGFTVDWPTIIENQNPRWVNPNEGDYHLQENSPCINAGDPQTEPDPDGTVADLGRHHFSVLGVADPKVPSTRPAHFALEPAWPNPFNGTTRAAVLLPEAGRLTVDVIDVLGRRVAMLHDGPAVAGRHELLWQTSGTAGIASGTYLLRAVSAHQVQVQRVVLLK